MACPLVRTALTRQSLRSRPLVRTALTRQSLRSRPLVRTALTRQSLRSRPLIRTALPPDKAFVLVRSSARLCPDKAFAAVRSSARLWPDKAFVPVSSPARLWPDKAFVPVSSSAQLWRETSHSHCPHGFDTAKLSFPSDTSARLGGPSKALAFPRPRHSCKVQRSPRYDSLLRTVLPLQQLAHVRPAVRARNQVDTPPVNPTYRHNQGCRSTELDALQGTTQST